MVSYIKLHQQPSSLAAYFEGGASRKSSTRKSSNSIETEVLEITWSWSYIGDGEFGVTYLLSAFFLLVLTFEDAVLFFDCWIEELFAELLDRYAL